jgi:hypothetical protein
MLHVTPGNLNITPAEEQFFLTSMTARAEKQNEARQN